MKKRFKYILPALLLAFSSCSIFKHSNKGLNDKQESKFIYVFSEANKFRLLGENEKAVENYLSALELKPKSAVVNFYMATIFSSEKQYESAEQFVDKAVKLSPDNFWYKLAKGDIFIMSGKRNEAKEVYEELSKENPNSDLLFERLERLYSETENDKELIKLYENYLDNQEFENEKALKLYDLYRKNSEVSKSETLLLKIIDFNPDSPKYKALLAEYYIAVNKNNKAQEIYNVLMLQYPDNNEILFSYAYYCKYSGNRKEYYSSVYKLMSADFDLSVKINLIISGQYPNFPEAEYLNLLNELYSYHSDEMSANTLFAEYYIDKNEFNNAIIYIKKATEIDKNNFNLILTLFELYYDAENYNELYISSNNYKLVYPNRPKVFLYNGIAAYKINKFKEATEALSLGKDLVINDKLIEVQFNYYLAESYKNLKDYNNSDKYYEKTIEINNKYYPALLSYSINLSLRKSNLIKAEELALICYKNDTKDPAFNYAYALALYKSENYIEAIKISEKLMALSDSNPVYLELHGDISFVLNKKDEALKYWNLAKEKGSKNSNLVYKIENIEFLKNPNF